MGISGGGANRDMACRTGTAGTMAKGRQGTRIAGDWEAGNAEIAVGFQKKAWALSEENCEWWWIYIMVGR